MTSLNRSTAHAIVAAMAARGITQRMLAAELHIAQSGVSRRLAGEVPFTLRDVEQFAAALGVPAADLIHTRSTAGAA